MIKGAPTKLNSSVCIDATDPNGNKEIYYGRIEEIWELDYGPYFKVPLFQCQWVKVTGGRVTVYTKIWKKNCRDSKAPKIISLRKQLHEGRYQLI